MDIKKENITDIPVVKKKNKIITIAIIVVTIGALVYVGVSLTRIIGLSAEKHSEQIRNEELIHQKEDLTGQLNNIESPEYLEKIARRDLKLVKKNELLFVLPEFTEEKVDKDKKEDKNKDE